jgi:AraC family transcriptional regulator of adaptative response/methylated-DNA-[protein]-cysteine methyltransferase
MIREDRAPAAKRIEEICRYIEAHSEENLSLESLAQRAGMSRFHFQRTFKALVGVTPKQYHDTHRLRALKTHLQSAPDVTAAVYDAGYGSSSRVYERADTRLGMTPKQYRAAGKDVQITYVSFETPLGLLMVGATDRGLCFVQFGETHDELEGMLRTEYPHAAMQAMREPHDPHFTAWVDALRRHLQGVQPDLALPADIRATAFQLRVWAYLQQIPYGQVRSYSEVAQAIGRPGAARAVARACASNVLALVIPCHRVIRGTGELGGYRWGIERKRILLDQERSVTRGRNRAATRGSGLHSKELA